MTWPDLAPLSEEELELLLYGPPKLPVSLLPLPDWALVDAERRRPGVTLLLLHEEYKQSHPNGLSYSQFCEQYRRFRLSRPLLQRQEYVAGDKMLVDYSGKRPQYFDPATGQRIDCELFVAVLGASNLTFAHASATQRREDFLRSHMRAVEYFGGVTRLWIPDNLKSAVTRACRYEPTVQRDYQELAEHYGAAILPTRPYKPRDKAKVEVAVQIAQRWILARLRNVRCFSLAELNGHIRRLLEELNHRLMPGYGRSRWELFAQIEKDKLRPLPEGLLELSETKEAKVQIDSHVALRSLPIRLLTSCKESLSWSVRPVLPSRFSIAESVSHHICALVSAGDIPRCPSIYPKRIEIGTGHRADCSTGRRGSDPIPRRCAVQS